MTGMRPREIMTTEMIPEITTTTAQIDKIKGRITEETMDQEIIGKIMVDEIIKTEITTETTEMTAIKAIISTEPTT